MMKILSTYKDMFRSYIIWYETLYPHLSYYDNLNVLHKAANNLVFHKFWAFKIL